MTGSIQRIVASFVEAHGLEASAHARLLDFVSEVGEISKEYLKATDYGRRDFEPPEGWPGELADALFALVCLANGTDVDLERVLDGALRKYEARLARGGGIGSGR